MYIYIYIYIYGCLTVINFLFHDKWSHKYIHTNTHTHIHTYIHTYIYACIHIHTHVYIHTHTYVYTFIHTYTHTYMHACIHTYIHTNYNFFKTDKRVRQHNTVCVTVRLRVINYNVQISMFIEETKAIVLTHYRYPCVPRASCPKLCICYLIVRVCAPFTVGRA
jgi:hypothetical protein